MKLTIARSLLIFGLTVGAGLVTAIATQNHAFDRLKVNGPVYQQVVYGKDLVADILPPPLFLVEAYLLATESAYHPELAADDLIKIAKLKKDYMDRRAYWPTTDLAADLKTQLTQQVEPTSDAFWRIIDGQYTRAITSGDTAAVRNAMMELKDAFNLHQAEVVKLVSSANAFLASSEKQAAEETALWTTLSYIAAGAALTLLAIGLIAMHRRAILPLRGMRNYMSVLARGDYSQPVPYDGRQDEIGEMAAAVTVFRHNAQERIVARQRQETEREQALASERAEQARQADEDAQRAEVIHVLGSGLERLAVGDLTARITAAFPADYERLRAQFNGSIESLAQTLSSIDDTTRAVRSGAASISSGTNQLSRRTETQAASLEEAASALTQITANVRSTTDRAREANSRMTDAKHSAEVSTTIVQDAVLAMSKIEQSSSQIRQIISVIDEIAFQTNLLALNAGVEAARAGDAGKGFAVVAQEVRELAGRSAGASREIRQLIDASTAEVDTGVSLVNRTGAAINAIEDQVQKVNNLISAIVHAAGEQAQALAEISEAVNQMDGVTQQNAAMAEEANAACNDLNGYTDTLAQNLARFTLSEPPVSYERLRRAS